MTAAHSSNPVSATIPERVPGLDALAAQRWQRRPLAAGAWLQQEVGRRMAERLGWMLHKPQDGLLTLPQHASLSERQAVQAQCPQLRLWQCDQDNAAPSKQPWWCPSWAVPRDRGLRTLPADAAGVLDMVWANMALHVLPYPAATFSRWLRLLKVQGVVMCSGLGPDSLRELREVYGALDWPLPAHPFTDMHDWGDMLVQNGFAQPVMDMERIALSYQDPAKLLADMRDWGRNLSSQRFKGCRSKGYKQALEHALQKYLPRDANGHMTLTLEIIYGHAVKPLPRAKLEAQTQVSLQDMREMLRPKS